eukprot:4002903-Amphidinium_carterae.3
MDGTTSFDDVQPQEDYCCNMQTSSSQISICRICRLMPSWTFTTRSKTTAVSRCCQSWEIFMASRDELNDGVGSVLCSGKALPHKYLIMSMHSAHGTRMVKIGKHYYFHCQTTADGTQQSASEAAQHHQAICIHLKSHQVSGGKREAHVTKEASSQEASFSLTAHFSDIKLSQTHNVRVPQKGVTRYAIGEVTPRSGSPFLKMDQVQMVSHLAPELERLSSVSTATM